MVTYRIALMRLTLTTGICLVTFGFIAGCTRNRSTPQPTATAAEAEISVITGSQNLDPVVTVGAVEVTATSVVTSGTPTAAQLVPTTIDYYVTAGDTLLSVAQKFGVTVETIRQLNYLLDDNIFVGQILQMPYSEGITAEGAPTPTPAPYRYTIQEGDSLGSIAQQFGVSAVSIMEANNLQNPNNVFIGQELEIPNYIAPTPAASTNPGAGASTADANSGSSVTHVVQPGETLTGIAQKYGVDATALASANNIANRNQLRAGQQLTIPGISAIDAARALGRVHTVQSGESLSAIAQQYGVSAQEIIAFNNIANPDSIYVGQELMIPGQE
ncbi:MAG: LysM peptidoglycan-binding domain-containing protein [Caldilineaceae bacterium]|nr:LysM peptidoglycan-binding domain-containing protein [Caldilineaceae bacterium]